MSLEDTSLPLLPEVYDQLREKINLEIDRLQLRIALNIGNGHGDENEYLEYQAQALNDSVVLLGATQIKEFNIKKVIEDLNSFQLNYFKDCNFKTIYYRNGILFVINLLRDL